MRMGRGRPRQPVGHVDLILITLQEQALDRRRQSCVVSLESTL